MQEAAQVTLTAMFQVVLMVLPLPPLCSFRHARLQGIIFCCCYDFEPNYCGEELEMSA